MSRPVTNHDSEPRVVARRAGAVRAGADEEPGVEHGPDRRGGRGGRCAVALGERAALEYHAVLDRDRSAERLDAIQVALGDRLGVVEEPSVVAGETAVGGDPVEDVEMRSIVSP